MAKPVILSVDDDEEVLGAIERDLRARYRGRYRVLPAATPREAIEATQELKRRGTPVALFLADQRMPEMTGTEVLAQVQKLYPDSRRVLLTAYADTEAAIAGINSIGLDHYLMKPWDPPEEKLYPVLDDLLLEWSSHVRPPYEGIRVAGARWSAQCYGVKEFLSRNMVPYQWIDVDQDAAMRETVSALPGSEGKLPAVFFPDGTTLLAPSAAELAQKVGLQTRARLPFYDLVIIGAGPAGLANAVYGASEGLKTLVIEQSAPGGQAGSSSRIENYLGFPSGVTGADLAQRASSQARRFGAELLTAQRATGLRREDPYRVVTLSDGSEVSAYAVVITTGMAVRLLDAPGVEPLIGAGVYYGAAMTEAAACKDRDVCVVGGANSAGQGALFFARYARTVTMLVRADTLSPPMSRYLADRICATPNIRLLHKVEVAAAHGTTGLESVTVRAIDTAAETELPAAAMFVFIGTAPHSEMLEGFLQRDEQGFILTGPDIPRFNGKPKGWLLDRDPFLFETSVAGVFAAGDVRSGANRRVAAAVGEGSAAIYSVQRYLQTV